METTVQALAIAVQARVPVLLWGAPGTGKSSVVRQLGAELGLPVETVIASIREPSDFAGLPVVTEGGVRFAPPDWAVRLAGAGRGILFLDEISTAPPAVQAALLRVVLERTVGDLELPAEVALVAAANPPEEAAGGWELSPPLANRFCHLEWRPHARSVAEGFASGWRAVSPRRFDAAEAERALARERAALAGFLTARPDLALEVPARRAGRRAWASPRSWEFGLRLWCAGLTTGVPEVALLLLEGSVGPGAAAEWVTWRREADLPDPEALLAAPERFEVPERGDVLFAVLGAVVTAVAGKLSQERWRAGWRIIAKAAERAPDVAVFPARTLLRAGEGTGWLPEGAGRLLPVLELARPALR